MHHELPLPVAADGLRWYLNAGLLIASELSLDELAAPAPPGTPDVRIARLTAGAFDAILAEASLVKTVGSNAAVWLEVHRAAEPAGYALRWPKQLDVFVPDGGNEILVCERGEVEDSIARLLLCFAMSFVVFEHGRETIHASAVEMDGAGVVISGDSGMGKSTLATALCLAGARLVADDIGVVGAPNGDAPMIEPSSTRTWLLHDVAAAFGRNGNGSARIHKTTVGGDGMVAAGAAVPVGRVIILRYRPGDDFAFERLHGHKAAVAILSLLFNRVVRTPERLAGQFALATALAERTEVVALHWTPGPDRAREVAAHLFAEARGNGRSTKKQRHRLLARLRDAGMDGLSEESLDEPLLQTSEVAALLRASDRTVRTWADAGKLPYIKTLGGRRLFPASGVASVLAAMNGRHDKEE